MQGGASAASEPASELVGAVDVSHKGEAIPVFTVRDATGKTLKLASLKGQPALINLWATWCAPCVAELPTLDQLAADTTGKLRVVTISQDMQPSKVAPFLKDNDRVLLEPWLDPTGELSSRYGATTLPTTIMYDAAGKETWRYVGGHDWSAPDVEGLLAQVGVERTPPDPLT